MLLKIARTLHQYTSHKLTTYPSISIRIQKCFSTEPATESNALDFDDDQVGRILSIINTKSRDHLASYEISKAKLNKIEAWKQKNGTFKSLDDILHLDGFSMKIVEKFCKSLLGEVPSKRPPRKATSFVTPVMPESQIKDIKSSVSVNIGVTSIIWSRLQLNEEGPSDLTHWQLHEIQDKKLHLNDLIHRCLYIDYQIPEADCYIFESPQIAQSAAPGNAEQVNINVQRAQLTAMLGFALANRKSPEKRSTANIFYLKRFLSARLFQHLIGTERVSAEKTILSLMRTYYNVDDLLDSEEEDKVVGGECFSSRGNVNFPSELRVMYKEAEGYHREFLGQSLLLNLAFVRLVLLRDVKSMAMVSRSSKASDVE